MNVRRFLFVISIAASMHFAGTAWGIEPMDVMGGSAFDWGFGWLPGSEAYTDSGWCGDTLDVDSTGTPTLLTCFQDQFIDTNGLTPGLSIINWKYKFRNYWAQLPIVWSGWRGIDATGYKFIEITYKGLLPVHQMRASFYYGYTDSVKNAEKRGDGLGLLPASPDQWKTVKLSIPDSIDLIGITGLALAIENAPGKGGQTSAIGTILVDRVTLYETEVSIAHRYGPVNKRADFTPRTGSVTLTVYSLKGETLVRKNVKVQSGKQYTGSRFIGENISVSSPQVRLISIEGDGVRVLARTR